MSRWFFIPLESVVFLVLALLSLPCRADIARVSVDTEGRQGNDWSSTPSISANGRYIAFMSAAD
ncbi:MAG: TolB family protein, partial [bacterium]